MRKLISYPAEPLLAQKLHAWLAVNQIDARCKQAGEEWEIWVLNEDQLPTARELAAAFNNNPGDPQFDAALKEANKIEEEKDKLQQARRKEANKLERQQQRPLTRSSKTLTRSIILLCSVLFGASLVFQSGDDGNFIHESLGVVRKNSMNESYRERIRLLQQLDGASALKAKKDVDKILKNSFNSLLLEDIKRGQLWRMVTPIFLHAEPAEIDKNSARRAITSSSMFTSFLHIFFNMYWLFALGLGIERHFGTGNFALLVLFTGVISILLPAISPEGGIFGLTALKGASVVGFSGVIYGIIGFGWIKMKMQPHLGIIIPPFVFIFMMIWLGIGLVSPEGGFFGAISHLAHAAGLLAGVAFGYIHTQLGH